MPNLKHDDYASATLALHAGYEYEGKRTTSVPLYQSSAYSFESLEQAANRFSLKEIGFTYSRMANPTIDVLAKRLAAIEGGAMSAVVASGSAAIFYAVLNLAEYGDNILYADKIYGGTQTLFVHTLKRLGISCKSFDLDDLSTLEGAIDERTKLIFFESLSNPQIAIADTEKITQIAKKHNIISICDNTVGTPFLHKPFEFGVDVSVYSLTKYTNGQGSTLGGAIIERKGLNEVLINNPRYTQFNTPDEAYHGLIYADLNLPLFCSRVLLEWLRNTGASLSPFNAWQLLQGLETLDLRIQKHSQNALKIAQFLEAHPLVEEVNYPALKTSPYHQLLQKYFKNNQASGLLSFEAKSFEAAQRICNELKLFSLVVNIGDSKSLIIHPFSTTHSQLSKEELKAAGITPSTLRLSIGLEDADDLIADLKQAIEKEG
ncbi:bifunctional O-acetylhomoserine aminocarboxypropyltransferase/cysteine synthase [Campylobacter sp. MIT 12-8780]|uniref:O-acetylhomoserine aminocarboxypropyltransferase/cysteine synthase family protein n=1 Tax=unclassified Campylobacter TaxID=2593542 RepID=UPI00115D663A|nr:MULTISPECIES: O-acetylhomoserine aminocarboxypropyltransferase/cysteine synthase family protein [unclassified Campylobacter]NDJ28087.1 O-acetylhomoserine aminocarboxypropyltransferase/cysteine synthase [Campylobacter sp. MIT 19-121]TQR40460.1 bifunctional O-acetylhomoserine aminocarboxypropyltransferase/cysteine synthase [Campylobacter sp. MIT 12-8780]